MREAEGLMEDAKTVCNKALDKCTKWRFLIGQVLNFQLRDSLGRFYVNVHVGQ